jgi:DUF1365 family protein
VNSALYTGTVRHRRHGEVEHTFTYRQTLLYLDLDEVPELMRRAWLWSARRPSPGRFERSDYHGPADVPLADAIRATVEAQTGATPQGPVRLLCRARTFGHVFNPVTFAYCFDRCGEHLQAVVADATNTPWGERHPYVLTASDPDGTLHEQLDKVFHVSPLMSMDHRYDVRVTTPGVRLAVHIAASSDGRPAFDVTLLLTRAATLTPRVLDRTLLRHPAESLKALGLVYTNALVLKLKGAAYYPHPEHTP